MLAGVFRVRSAAFRAAEGSMTGDSAGRAIRGILVGVAEGGFWGDSRSEDAEPGCLKAGEPLMEGRPLLARFEVLPVN